jgi:hypothetical protein
LEWFDGCLNTLALYAAVALVVLLILRAAGYL